MTDLAGINLTPVGNSTANSAIQEISMIKAEVANSVRDTAEKLRVDLNPLTLERAFNEERQAISSSSSKQLDVPLLRDLRCSLDAFISPDKLEQHILSLDPIVAANLKIAAIDVRDAAYGLTKAVMDFAITEDAVRKSKTQNVVRRAMETLASKCDKYLIWNSV